MYAVNVSFMYNVQLIFLRLSELREHAGVACIRRGCMQASIIFFYLFPYHHLVYNYHIKQKKKMSVRYTFKKESLTLSRESQTQRTLPSGDHAKSARSLVSTSKCCKVFQKSAGNRMVLNVLV